MSSSSVLQENSLSQSIPVYFQLRDAPECSVVTEDDNVEMGGEGRGEIVETHNVPQPLLPNQVVTLFPRDDPSPHLRAHRSSFFTTNNTHRESPSGITLLTSPLIDGYRCLRESKKGRVGWLVLFAFTLFSLSALCKSVMRSSPSSVVNPIDPPEGILDLAEVRSSLGPRVCESKDYRDTTLKLNYEQSFLALWGDRQGEVKFEASDVTMVNDTLYVVFDNSWAVGEVTKDLRPYSAANAQYGMARIPGQSDSQWEAIVYNERSNTFWVTREAIPHAGTAHYHAVMLEISLEPLTKTYRTDRSCAGEFVFTGANKGFEGMIGMYDTSGQFYLIGLCEGNHCAGGHKGQEAGHGRLVIMSLEEGTGRDAPSGCVWHTKRVVNLPSEMKFIDYSAVATLGKRIAITSQENSQLWISELEGIDDNGAIDVERFSVSTKNAQVYNFPRSDDCHIEYCNVEGIHFIDEQILVTVSDRMKGGGRQDYRCLAKDQSVHVFSLPA